MKRTILWSTGSAIAALKKFMTVTKKDFEFTKKTAVKYVNSCGEVAYKGTTSLKETQCPSCYKNCFVVLLNVVLCLIVQTLSALSLNLPQ